MGENDTMPTPTPTPDSEDLEFLALADRNSKLGKSLDALAAECSAVAVWWERFAVLVRKGIAVGSTSLEVLAAANGIPLPPGVLGEATRAAAEKVLAQARGSIAGAGPSAT